jgi:hypothetical protein
LVQNEKGDKLFTSFCFIYADLYLIAGYFLSLFSSDTVSFLRPFALLLANTLRPFFVAILALNPCLLDRFLLDG